MFGYIICGVLLGPSGLNSIKVRIILTVLVSNKVHETDLSSVSEDTTLRCL